MLDFQQHAKLNFDERVCQIPELEIGSDWLWSAYEFKMTIVPAMLKNAMKRRTSTALIKLQSLLSEQLEEAKCGASSRRLAEMEISIQKHMASMSNNPFFVFHSNTMQNLHVLLMTTLYDAIDAKEYLKRQLVIVDEIINSDIKAIEEKYSAFLSKSIKSLEIKQSKRRKSSYLVSSPLRHKSKMITLETK